MLFQLLYHLCLSVLMVNRWSNVMYCFTKWRITIWKWWLRNQPQLFIKWYSHSDSSDSNSSYCVRWSFVCWMEHKMSSRRSSASYLYKYLIIVHQKCVLCTETEHFSVKQVMNNIKWGIYSFYVRHNLTVGFLRHCAQYGHYFIRQLSAATCCQFTVLTWPTVLTATGVEKWQFIVTDGSCGTELC